MTVSAICDWEGARLECLYPQPAQPIEALLSKEKNKIAFFSSAVRETAV